MDRFVNLINMLNQHSNILNRSFNDQGDSSKPCSASFVDKLEKVLVVKNAIQDSNDGLLKNKTFLVTGKLNGISRAEVKSLIEENSGKTVSSVSKKLNYLIIGDKPTKKKIDNAKKLRINVIDQAEFMKMLNKTS